MSRSRLWPSREFAAPNSQLYLLDLVKGRLLRIDSTGTASLARSLSKLPSALSTPAVDSSGKMLMFAADSKPFPPANADEAEKLKPLEVPLPAMLIFDAGRINAIDRDHVLTYPGYPIFGMRIRQLLPNPSQQEWIGYDAGSGELLRLKIREKLWQ